MPHSVRPSFNAKRMLIIGAFWTVGSRWVIKGVGFLNTVIMARLLMPEDYGVVAMAMLLVSLIQALMDFGAANALLRKDKVSQDEVDSAWTLRMLQSLGIGVILVAAAPIAHAYFTEPRVELVLRVLAGCVALNGLSNIGMVLAEKNFNFALDFKLNVISKVLSVLATVSAGFLLRDYRALVIGIGTSYISSLLLSYWLHPYRPSWNTRAIPEIWAVTKWLMLSGIGTFLLRRTDEIVAARIGSTGEFGTYNVGADLGALPTGELGPAMMRALLPVLTSLQEDLQRANAAVIKTLSAVNSITLPIGMGVAAVAIPMTDLILGDKWAAAGPFVALFAILGSLQFMMHPLLTLLVMRGFTRTRNRATWIEFICFAVAAVALVPWLHLMGLAWARLLASVVSSVVVVFSVKNCCGLSKMEVLRSLWRQIVGAVLMYFLVQQVSEGISSQGAQLFVGVAAGVVFYSLWLVASWYLVGRPQGLESTALEMFKRRGRSA